MKYFKIFNTEEEYTEYLVSSDFIAPNVSTLRDCSNTWINAERPEPEEKDYFAFVARENATFSFTNSIEYSLDNGLTWAALAANTQSPSIASGEKIMWKKEPTRNEGQGIGKFSATGDFDAIGNALSLVYGDDFEYQTSIEGKNHIFKELFKDNTHIINADEMKLEAMFLSTACYDSMFYGCTSLLTAPELPAANLTPYCYRSMFGECTSLTTMPSMGMVAVAEGSCQYMFFNCSSLTSVASKLEPETLAINCYDSMFQGCSSITGSPELPATELVSQCYNHMFFDCTNLAFIKAAFVTTPGSGYTHEWVGGSNDTFGVAEVGQFFKGIDAKWENVVSVNAIPSGWTVLGFDTVYFSFTNKDTNNDNVEFSFTKATASDTLYWSRDYGQSWNEYTEPINTVYNENIVFKGELTANGTNGIGTFSANGLFNVYGNVMSLIYGDNYKNQTTLKADYNFAHLLEDCTHLVEAFELVLPSTTLRSHCYDSMFKGCWSMISTPQLNAMALAEGCYANMFYDCESIDEACELPATTLAANCYSHMFEECEELYKNIYLPAETLVSGCYDYMFKGTRVNYVNAMFTTAPGTSYTNNWLADVSEYGTFIVNSSASWALDCDNYRGESGIPAYTAETEPGVTAYTWNVVGSDYETRWNIVTTGTCSAQTTLRYELYEEEYSEDGGTTWHSFNPQVFSAKTLAEKSIHCGFLSGDTDDTYDSSYIDEKVLKNADLTFVNEDGMPNIKTDADGYVTEFTYTDATDDSPVMFNGSDTVDTVYHAFKTSGARNFEIIMKAYCDGTDQVYRSGADDNMVNLFTLRGESGGSVTYADGFSFRISKNNTNHLVLNGNAGGQGFGNPYIVDDGSHLWYFKIRYINGFLSVYDMKNNRYVPTINPWGTGGNQCDFNLDDGCSAVLACAVRPDESYYRYCKCKFFEFSLKTLFPQERDRIADINVEYICDNGDKYYKVYHEISYDGGETWTATEFHKGDLYELDSPDCHNDYESMYFTIESLENSNAIKMQRSKSPNNPTLEYSLNSGLTWTTVQITGTVTFATINSGETIIFRGNNTKLASAWDTYNYFTATKQFKVYGNIMSLLNGSGFTENSEFANNSTHNFAGLLRTTYIVDASNLILPALTCMQDSYNGMFRGATALRHGPQMLATTPSGTGCCSSMFEGCINLEEPIEINFTTLSQQCCWRMFCMSRETKLTTPKMTKSPILRCNTAAQDCYAEMFEGNGNLNEITCLLTNNVSATANWVRYAGAGTGTFYKHPDKTWTQGETYGVPSGWDIVDYEEE